MNFNEENEWTPSPNLLPFGGFEVAALLLKLQRGESGISSDEDLLDFQPMTRDVSSGWLRSKILAG